MEIAASPAGKPPDTSAGSSGLAGNSPVNLPFSDMNPIPLRGRDFLPLLTKCSKTVAFFQNPARMRDRSVGNFIKNSASIIFSSCSGPAGSYHFPDLPLRHHLNPHCSVTRIVSVRGIFMFSSLKKEYKSSFHESAFVFAPSRRSNTRIFSG